MFHLLPEQQARVDLIIERLGGLHEALKIIGDVLGRSPDLTDRNFQLIDDMVDLLEEIEQRANAN